MRKSTFVKPLSCCLNLFFLFALGSAALPAFSQDAVPAATPPKDTAPIAAAMPTDPKALMLLAARTNGLTGGDVKPWHLNVTYKSLDDQGKVTDQGTFEELWASPTRYKQTFTSQNYTLTEFGTEKGIVSTGAQEAPRDNLMEMAREFVDPLPSATQTAHLQFEIVPLDLGTIHLTCLQVGPNPGGISANVLGHRFCINTEKPALRVTKNYFSHASYIHNHLVSYQGRFVAGDLVLQKGGKNALMAHLESVEPLADADTALLQPSSDAKPLEVKLLSDSLAEGMLLRKVQPDYPPIARDARVSGTVVIQAKINKEGGIENLQVVSGPPMLQQAALDAVKQWRYRPYLLDGEPVEVLTTVNVFFSLAGPGPSY
jgi:TonB family protein